MAKVTLYQRNDPTGTMFQWHQLGGGDEFETGPMSECVSLAYIDGGIVRGYHAGGSLKWANWTEIKSLRDAPRVKIVVVMGFQRKFGKGWGTVSYEVVEVIEEHGFQYIEWQFYQSSNAIITPTGAVRSATDNAPVPRLFSFISKFRPADLAEV